MRIQLALVVVAMVGGAAGAEEEERAWLTIETTEKPFYVRVARVMDDGELGPWTQDTRAPCRIGLVPGLYQVRWVREAGARRLTTRVGVPPEGVTMRLSERREDPPPSPDAQDGDDNRAPRIAGGVALLFLGTGLVVATVLLGFISLVLAHFSSPSVCFPIATAASAGGAVASIVGGAYLLTPKQPRTGWSVVPTRDGLMGSAFIRF